MILAPFHSSFYNHNDTLFGVSCRDMSFSMVLFFCVALMEPFPLHKLLAARHGELQASSCTFRMVSLKWLGAWAADCAGLWKTIKLGTTAQCFRELAVSAVFCFLFSFFIQVRQSPFTFVVVDAIVAMVFPHISAHVVCIDAAVFCSV